MTDHPEPSFSFDHLIHATNGPHATNSFDATMQAYDAVGLPTHAALTMPGFRNAAWGIDDERYVELAVVEDWDAVADSPFGDSLSLLRAVFDASAPGLAAFAVHVPDAHATAASLRENGHDVHVADIRLEDRDAGFTEVFVTDAPAWFPFFISYDPPRATIARMRAEHRVAQGGSPEQPSTTGPDISCLLVRSDAPHEDAHRLAEVLDLPVRDDPPGATVLLPGAEIRFTRGSPTGLYGFGVVRTGPDGLAGPVEIAGATVVPDD